MQQYQGFFITIALLVLVVLTSRYFNWWVKGILTVYFLTFSVVFITVKNKIDQKFEGMRPVPEAYRDQNTAWVSNMSCFLFLPLVGILIYIYFKWIRRAKTAWAKVIIVLTLIPVGVILLVSNFLFHLTYGYRP